MTHHTQSFIAVHETIENQDPARVGSTPGEGESKASTFAANVPEGNGGAEVASRPLAQGLSALRADAAEDDASSIESGVRVPELDDAVAQEVRVPELSESDAEEVRVPEPDDEQLSDEAEALIEQLRNLTSQADTAWEIAEICYQLVHVHGVKQATLVRRLGKAKATVSEWISAGRVAEAVKEEMPDYREKLGGVHKAKKVETSYKMLSPRVRDRRSLKDFVEDSADKTPRQVRRKWSDEELKVASEENAERAAEVSGTHSFEGRVFPQSCLQWMDEESLINPKAYRALYADVPYPYTTYDKLPVDHSQVSGLRVDCANAERQQAIDLTVGIIQKSRYLLAEGDGSGDNPRGGGVLLLMQAGGQHVLPEIIEAVDEADMEIRFLVQIDTGHSKLANPAHPYGRSSESLLVIKRKSDSLIRCDTRVLTDTDGHGNLLGPHTSVISERQLRAYAAEWQILNQRRLWRYHPNGLIRANATKQHSSSRARPEYRPGEVHLFQKNEAQLLMVLSKHCLPGDMMADLCGCSASCCIAADQMGVDWRYIELDPDNYNFGLSRLTDYFEAKRTGFVAAEEELDTWRLEAKADRIPSTEIRKALGRLISDAPSPGSSIQDVSDSEDGGTRNDPEPVEPLSA